MIRMVNEAVYNDGDEVKYLQTGSCLSTDTKPTAGIANGSIIVESDTGTVFFYNEDDEEWVEQFSFQS